MAEENNKTKDISEKEEKDLLARGEIKTMKKDIAGLRETQSKQERDRIAKIKTAEETQKEKARQERAEKAAEERELATKEVTRKEQDLKRMKESREKREKGLEKAEVQKEELRAEEFKSVLKETQTKEEEERKRFLERVEAKAEGKEEITPPLIRPIPPSIPQPMPPPIPSSKKPAKIPAFLKKPSLTQKLWIRIVLSLLVLAVLAAIVTFWYWYLVIREESAPTPPLTPPITEEEPMPEIPEVLKPLINERALDWGYNVPTISRTIDTIIIHSVYNALWENPHDIEGVIQEYKIYKVAAHYLIARDGTIYRLAPDEAIAYHAGVSQMPDGRTGVNNFSLGIEIIHTKTEFPTEVQYQSLAQLVKYLKQEYNVPLENILGHKDIAPERKTDPWNFDWEKLNELIK